MHPKFESLVDRLVSKMEMSQVPVPGFIIGLSGTDSLVAFMLCYRAAEKMGITNYVHGVHLYVEKRTWFDKEIIPWLDEHFIGANVKALSGMLHFSDEYRWAAIRERAKSENLWTVGTMNATEKALGKYSLASTAVSLQSLQKLWKTEILDICRAYEVPSIAIENSMIPDCMCGRDEFYADNIRLIDSLLSFGKIEFNSWDKDYPKIKKALEYIQTEKTNNGFRDRIPYTL
jgi:NH3-dependent NAD+ synthetase